MRAGRWMPPGWGRRRWNHRRRREPRRSSGRRIRLRREHAQQQARVRASHPDWRDRIAPHARRAVRQPRSRIHRPSARTFPGENKCTPGHGGPHRDAAAHSDPDTAHWGKQDLLLRTPRRQLRTPRRCRSAALARHSCVHRLVPYPVFRRAPLGTHASVTYQCRTNASKSLCPSSGTARRGESSRIRCESSRRRRSSRFVCRPRTRRPTTPLVGARQAARASTPSCGFVVKKG